MWPAASVFALGDEDILHPEEAYRYAVTDTGDALEIDWAVEDGYYLYREKMSYESNTPAIVFGQAEMPTGESHSDEFFGEQEIYRGRFFVRIPYTVEGGLPASMDLVLKSQGCADLGICYPPQTWTEPVRMMASNTVPDDKSEKLTFGSTFGSSLGDFLPVDQAFKPMLIPLDGNTVEVSFQIAPGYYLYKDKIPMDASFLRMCKRATLQYVLLKPLLTFIAILLDLVNLYEEGSFALGRFSCTYLYIHTCSSLIYKG